MALIDFLGSTTEIKIIDFLAENMDMSYNQTEISECLGMSRTVVNQKIPKLIYNNIIEIKESKGNTKKYGLNENSLVNKIISVIYDHSFRMAEYDQDEADVLSEISTSCQISSTEALNCYCGEPRYVGFTEMPGYHKDQVDKKMEWEEPNKKRWEKIQTVCASA